MKKYLTFILLSFCVCGLQARKPSAKPSKHKHSPPKQSHAAHNVAPALQLWAADFVWHLNSDEKNKDFQAKPSHDKEVKGMIKYLYQSLKKDTSEINFSLLEANVEKPVAALQTEKRYILFNPQKLNIDLYGPHIAGIVYQIGHHILGHSAKMNEKKTILEADSFYGYCITTQKALVASGHGRKLLDSLPETSFKKQRISALEKGISAGKEGLKGKISEEMKKRLAEAKIRAAKQKRFYIGLFVSLLIILTGTAYWFRIKH